MAQEKKAFDFDCFGLDGKRLTTIGIRAVSPERAFSKLLTQFPLGTDHLSAITLHLSPSK